MQRTRLKKHKGKKKKGKVRISQNLLKTAGVSLMSLLVMSCAETPLRVTTEACHPLAQPPDFTDLEIDGMSRNKVDWWNAALDVCDWQMVEVPTPTRDLG